jgi:acylphosphatase
MTDRRGYRITGRVQGVGFRWWTRQTATDLGLRGTVRNARDGSVEVAVAGDPEPLDRFEERLARGPASARVDDLQTTEPGEDDLPAGFEIIR